MVCVYIYIFHGYVSLQYRIIGVLNQNCYNCRFCEPSVGSLHSVEEQLEKMTAGVAWTCMRPSNIILTAGFSSTDISRMSIIVSTREPSCKKLRRASVHYDIPTYPSTESILQVEMS